MNIKPSAHIVTHKFDNSFFIFNSKTGRIYSLNESASFLWKYILRGTNEETLVKKVCSRYNVSSETAKRDVLEFIKRYLSRKLIIKSKHKPYQ